MAAPPPAYPAQETKSGFPGSGGQGGSSIPPPAGYHPMYGQPAQPGYAQSTVVITQPPFIATQQFREISVRTKCPACHNDVLTSTHFETGTFTWLIVLILCLFGLWLGCCLIPLCINGCKDVIHSCPNCRHQIARYNRM